jgi:hypothetical protein
MLAGDMLLDAGGAALESVAALRDLLARLPAEAVVRVQ